MKKMISILTVIAAIFSVCVITSSAETSSNVFVYDNAEIVVESNDLSYEKMKFIADNIAGTTADTISESVAEPYNLLCIFGHKKVVSSVAETRHNVYDTTPKCVRNIYEITTCERENCDLFESEVVYSTRTAACHG